MATKGPSPDPFYVFHGFNGGVSAVSFVESNGTDYLITGDSSGECALWDLATMKQIWKHRGETSGLWLKDHNETKEKQATQPSILACGSWTSGIWTHARGCCVRFWTFEKSGSPEECSTIPCPYIGFCNASILSSENFDLISIPVERQERQYIEVFRLIGKDVSSFATITAGNRLDGISVGAPMSCLLSKQGKTASTSNAMLIIGFESGTVQIWMVDPSPAMVAEETICQDSILALDFLPIRRLGFCVSPGKEINCWQFTNEGLDNSKIAKRCDVPLPKAGSSCVRIRNDGKIFAVGGWDSKIRIFSVKKLSPLAVLQFHSDVVRCLAFSDHKINDRRILTAGSKDGSLSLWNLYSD